MRRFHARWCVAVGALLVAGHAWAGTAPPAAARGLSASDTRLMEVVSAWEGRVAAGDLLDRLSQAAGVRLTCEAADQARPVTVYARDVPLRDLLGRLASLLSGSWKAEGAGYHLRPLAPPPTLGELDERLLTRAEAVQRFEAGAVRKAREARLRQYREALTLSREDLLARYEQSDPWCCLDLFLPQTRGLAGLVLSLDEARQQRLLSEGSVSFPLADLPAPQRHFLGEWAQGRWGPTGGMSMGLNPDWPSRFVTPQERWANAVVRLDWARAELRVALLVPDVYVFHTPILCSSVASDGAARRRLALLTGRSQALPAPPATPARGAAAASAEDSRAEQSDPLLSRPGRLPASSRGSVALSEMLAEVAGRTGMPLLAHALPPERESLPRSALGAPSLDQTLDWLTASRHGLLTWRIEEGWLVLSDLGADLLPWEQLPAGLAEEWRARTGRLEPIALADLAALAGLLNVEQLNALQRQVPALSGLPLFELRLYGRLAAEKREALGRGQSVAVAGLPADQRRVALRQAQLTHPWLEEADLAAALLRLVPQTLCTEEPGVALLLEYHRPASPQDRDIVFVLPLAWRPHPTPVPLGELPAPAARPMDSDAAAARGPRGEE